MSPLTEAQYVVIFLRLERRVFVVATESMVARAMTFLYSSGAYTTLLCSISFLKGKRRARALAESVFMIHLAIIWLFCEARSV